MDDLESLGIKYIHADASDCLAGVSEHRLPVLQEQPNKTRFVNDAIRAYIKKSVKK